MVYPWRSLAEPVKAFGPFLYLGFFLGLGLVVGLEGAKNKNGL
jgi:hypothetical protein